MTPMAFVGITAVVWTLIALVLWRLSHRGYPPEIKFPETEWPEMKKQPVDQREPINPSNVSNQRQGSKQ
jgi:hypothetical protein